MVGHRTVWIFAACALLVAMFAGFWAIGRARKVQMI
jgi:ABC-type antimicrobial peptide transport system permease subunit